MKTVKKFNLQIEGEVLSLLSNHSVNSLKRWNRRTCYVPVFVCNQ